MFPPDFNPNPAINVGPRQWVRHHFDDLVVTDSLPDVLDLTKAFDFISAGWDLGRRG